MLLNGPSAPFYKSLIEPGIGMGFSPVSGRFFLNPYIVLVRVPEHVFGPPGSGSVIICTAPNPDPSISLQKSVFLYILTAFWPPNYLYVPPVSHKQKIFAKNIIFCWHLESHWRKKHDPDPYVIKSFFLGDITVVATANFKLHSYKNISGYFGSVKDTSFTVGLQNIAPEDVDRVVNIIEDTLASVEAEGFPQQRIAAVLHSYELSLKHRSPAVLRPPGSASGSVYFWAS